MGYDTLQLAMYKPGDRVRHVLFPSTKGTIAEVFLMPGCEPLYSAWWEPWNLHLEDGSAWTMFPHVRHPGSVLRTEEK